MVMVRFHSLEYISLKFLMLLSPRKVKFQRQHSRSDTVGTKKAFDVFNLGSYGLWAEQSGKISGKQMESVRLILRRALKRQAKI